jgi:hypothetical protein
MPCFQQSKQDGAGQMLTKVDIIGKIQELYMQKRPVPYTAFMHVFNALLEDGRGAPPKEPSAALKEQFRAACMAANVGVVDTEGRAQERLGEFRRSVVPAWREKLPPGEFARFEEILGGEMSKKRGLKANAAEGVERESESRRRALLKRLGVDELETVIEPAAAVLAADVELPARLRVARRFGGVDELCRAMRAGELEPEYRARGKAGDFARYALDGVEVTVGLAEADGRRYTVLTARGVGRGAGSGQAPDDAAAEMGYRRMGDSAYMRTGDGLVCTLKIGADTVSIACAAADEGAAPEPLRLIQKLHRDLGELAERLKA